MNDLKAKLARIFDDNLETVQWKNVFDYTIIGLIVLSIAEIFLSTFDSVVEKYAPILYFVDIFTTIVFTIEITLRIWCADLLHDRYKGVVGRLRYCFSFYGLIDILSTFPFYLALFFPVNYAVFKSLRLIRVLRIFRLLRVFRYMKSIRVLGRAFMQCKTEMIVSLQFLCITTIILSFILYFVEHEVQPEVYDNGFVSVLWAFMQYIGDPGGFADTPPVTLTGRVIASVIGVLGIAIFAVPAGLIGSAFSDVMAEEAHEQECKEWSEKLHKAFERKLDRPSDFQICPRYLTLLELKSRMGMKEDEILDAIAYTRGFRLINLATTQPVEEHPQDRLAVECFAFNTPYGCFINRNSRVTIVSISNPVDAIIGWWSYYLALIGGFNFVSREFGQVRPYQSFYAYRPERQVFENQDLFMEDVNRLVVDDNHWLFTVMAASGGNEPTYPTELHFGCGVGKGDETYDDPDISVHDVETYKQLVANIQKLLKEEYDIDTDSQLYHKNNNRDHYYRHLEHNPNSVQLRVAWSISCWDVRSIKMVNDMAQVINRLIEKKDNPDVPALREKSFGYDGYDC